MEKVRLYRQSGKPVESAKMLEYEEEFKKLYDKTEAKADTIFAKDKGKLTRVPKMLIQQRMLSYGERLLTIKYNVAVEEELPKTKADIENLMLKYDGVPVMYAVNRNTNELIMLLMDSLQ